MHCFMCTGCQFYPVGEYLKFVRVPEDLAKGTEILSLEAHPRNHISIMPVDKVNTVFLAFLFYQATMMPIICCVIVSCAKLNVTWEFSRSFLLVETKTLGSLSRESNNIILFRHCS